MSAPKPLKSLAVVLSLSAFAWGTQAEARKGRQLPQRRGGPDTGAKMWTRHHASPRLDQMHSAQRFQVRESQRFKAVQKVPKPHRPRLAPAKPSKIRVTPTGQPSKWRNRSAQGAYRATRVDNKITFGQIDTVIVGTGKPGTGSSRVVLKKDGGNFVLTQPGRSGTGKSPVTAQIAEIQSLLPRTGAVRLTAKYDGPQFQSTLSEGLSAWVNKGKGAMSTQSLAALGRTVGLPAAAAKTAKFEIQVLQANENASFSLHKAGRVTLTADVAARAKVQARYVDAAGRNQQTAAFEMPLRLHQKALLVADSVQ